MAIESISTNLPSIVGKKEQVQSAVEGFGNILTEFIGDVNQSQFDAASITKNFINGENVEIHEVMIAGEKAKTSLELLMEIRNKTVDMYKELTRMSI
ncbi:MAG: flagellar hook-basal body complex protein FliE [Ignavibacteriaceae bacterium]|nr:flagellar hook-basal body complex protein FliE [Ignavibacteriaceae bacterium]